MKSIIGKIYSTFNFSNRVERIWKIAHIDFINRYYESYLGLLWALVNPIIRMAIYYAVFTIFLEKTLENYAFYLFTGLVIWIYFNECTNTCMYILQKKKYLIDSIQFNKLDLFLSSGISMLIGLIFNLLAYIIIASIFDIQFNWNLLYGIVLIVNLYIISVAAGIILSTIHIYFKDISHFWDLFTFVMFWTCPIFFRSEAIVEQLPIIMYVNPMSSIIMNSRTFLLDGITPDFFWLIYDMVLAILLFIIAIIAFRKFSDKIIEYS